MDLQSWSWQLTPDFAAYVIPNEVRDLGFCTERRELRFLALLGMTKWPLPSRPAPVSGNPAPLCYHLSSRLRTDECFCVGKVARAESEGQ
jgi:hypothetical protein